LGFVFALTLSQKAANLNSRMPVLSYRFCCQMHLPCRAPVDANLGTPRATSGVAMKMHHPPYHWIMIALVLVALLLTLSEAHGQATGAATVFEGRPSMAGAQAGQGAQAGPPQGGIGVQGNDLAGRGLQLRKPSGLQDMPQGKRDDNVDLAAANTAASSDVAARRDVAPARDRSLAKNERSSASKAKRAAKRTITRARHGVSEIDSVASTPAR
jgi:hypothetical protein